MKIAFLSSLNPLDIHNWSGTLYHIFHSLEKDHSIDWIGEEILRSVQVQHTIQNGRQVPFIPERYASLLGELCSQRINENPVYDVIVARDYFFFANLKTNIPIVYIGDTTFDLFKEYLDVVSSRFARLADDIEFKAISNADLIVYSSQWAKSNAVTYYGSDPEKIKVIEFGANIPETFIPDRITMPDTHCCNLLFIGRNWKNKGGKKAYDAYLALKNAGFNCSLTIIGCKPANNVNISDPRLQIIPFIDKSQEADLKRLDSIFRTTHFFILPTVFDCYGIAFCEASAYGIPSLAADVGGVHQVIKNGKNGYLFSPDANPVKYAQLIQDIFNDPEKYRQFRLSSRREFDERLNWRLWGKKMNNLLNQVTTFKKVAMEAPKEELEFYIPTYIINLPDRTDRKKHISAEFKDREEFDVKIIEACTHSIGAIGLWNSIVKIVRMAIEQDDDVIIICEDDHYFTEYYSKEYLIDNILQAHEQGADILSGGIGGLGIAVSVARNRYWVDWFWSTQFIVVYKKFYHQIVEYEFKDKDTADGVLSQLSNNTMTLYPFISRQKEFGYSDISQKNNDNPGLVTQYFEQSEAYLSAIHKISSFYNYPDYFEK